MLKRRRKRGLQLRSAFCLPGRAVPEVAVVRSEQDCDSAHADCRTAGHLQEKQEKWICVCVCAHIDVTLTSKNEIVLTLHTSV